MAVSGEGSSTLAPAGDSGLARYPADPAAWLALVSPAGGEGSGVMFAAPVAVATRVPEVADVAVLVERWVRRLSVGADPRRAAARLEIGAGRYAGAELVVVTDGGHVSVELNLPEPGGEPSLADRLRRRLEGRGYGVEVTVR